MTTLTDFLLARIAEDEADPWRGAELIGTDRVIGLDEERALLSDEKAWESRVLAECEAKRSIVKLAQVWIEDEPATWSEHAYVTAYTDVLRALAKVYADHADYDPEWKA